MRTMRNNFGAAVLLFFLMLSTGQSLLLHDHEDSPKRNILLDTLTPKSRSTSSSSTYECLFIDPDLPICNAEWMLSSEEDSSSDELPLNKDFAKRRRRDVDVSAMDVVVYTFEGCLPYRLPFSMPSCEGISLNRIVDIQKFRPFAVKGVTKPPFVFPEFNYSEWLRMMTRLRNHVSSKTREEELHAIKETSVEVSVQGRTAELMKAATTKETMPNAIAASMSNSNGSSPNRLIPDNSNASKSTSKLEEKTGDASSIEEVISVESSPESAEIPSVLHFHNRFTSMESDESQDHPRSETVANKIRAISAIPDVPMDPEDRLTYEQSAMEPSNELLNDDNSEQLPQLFHEEAIEEPENGLAFDFPLIGAFRRRRREEVRPPVPAQTIVERNPKAHRITSGKAIARQLKFYRHPTSAEIKQFLASKKQKKAFRSSKMSNQETAGNKEIPQIEIPQRDRESDFSSLKRNSGRKFDDSKATPRKGMQEGTTLRKKNRRHVRLPSFRRH